MKRNVELNAGNCGSSGQCTYSRTGKVSKTRLPERKVVVNCFSRGNVLHANSRVVFQLVRIGANIRPIHK